MAAPNLKGGIVEYRRPGEVGTYTAGAAIVGGELVKFSANRTVIKTTAATDAAAGVALHDAATGEAVSVAAQGVWPLKAGATIGFGDIVIPHATAGTVGPAGAAPDARGIVGQAEEGITSGATGRVRLRL
jgi:predicted RecA/RadA family phage recombinase